MFIWRTFQTFTVSSQIRLLCNWVIPDRAQYILDKLLRQCKTEPEITFIMWRHKRTFSKISCPQKHVCTETAVLNELMHFYHIDWTIAIHYWICCLCFNRGFQSIQKIAACILIRTCKCEHITPIPKNLHWLPVVSGKRQATANDRLWCDKFCAHKTNFSDWREFALNCELRLINRSCTEGLTL